MRLIIPAVPHFVSFWRRMMETIPLQRLAFTLTTNTSFLDAGILARISCTDFTYNLTGSPTSQRSFNQHPILPNLTTTHTAMASQTPTPPNGVTSSGITTDSVTGERYIPSSLRADGSKRKEIKVRPGYRPPEDVELYKNRAAEAWKNRGRTGGVPGAESLKENDTAKGGSAASNKNAKRREAKKKAKADGAATSTGKDISQIENWRAAPVAADKNQGDGEDAAAPVDPEVEKEKKARGLKKKLKQARDLKEKKNQGEALLPEQLEKVIKIQELIRQLDSLGFDANGDKKEGGEEEKPEK
ncbi:hypothetical protein BJY04DRAFT_197866 [Aspergillus karnatakaensis]|uniref:putative RNA binding protein Pym n=1 Tax=Aspergillus karnatakaensis TaxID=1810916 RepID=UPI003CCD312F